MVKFRDILIFTVLIVLFFIGYMMGQEHTLLYLFTHLYNL